MRYFRHVTQSNDIATSTDESVGHAVVPSEGSLNAVQGQVHCVVLTEIGTTLVAMYGCDGWMIPVNDPDTPDTIDDLWDRFVEKDFAIASFQMDTGGTDGLNFDEPGVGNVDRLAGLEALQQDKRFFRRRKMMSFASHPMGFLDGTPDTYQPADFFQVRARRHMEVDEMSVAIVGFGSPTMSSVTTTHPSSPSEAQWLQIKYMEVVLEQAWMDLAGLTESGAETPWEEATGLIADILEPTVVEDQAGALSNSAYRTFSQLTFDLSVPGRRNFAKALTIAS